MSACHVCRRNVLENCIVENLRFHILTFCEPCVISIECCFDRIAFWCCGCCSNRFVGAHHTGCQRSKKLRNKNNSSKNRLIQGPGPRGAQVAQWGFWRASRVGSAPGPSLGAQPIFCTCLIFSIRMSTSRSKILIFLSPTRFLNKTSVIPIEIPTPAILNATKC